MNYYPFHIGDYASATQHLTLEEDAMYRRLLDLQYTSEKPLTKDERQLFRLARATTEGHREALLTVLHEFFDETADGWVSRRAMLEIAAMQEKQEKQREKANRRWDKQRAEHGIAPALPQQAKADATASAVDADAMPPTPTPTPTPTPKKERQGEATAPVARSKAPRVFLPADFCPNESGMKAATAAGIDIDRELAQFRDHHAAKGDAMADWQAAWRTWVRNAVQWGRSGKAARAADPRPAWCAAAGFENVYEAQNAGCYAHTAKDFRDGKRIEVPA